MVARRIGSLLVAALLVIVTAPAVLGEEGDAPGVTGIVTDTLTGEPVAGAGVGLFTIVGYDPSHPLEDWPDDEPTHPQPLAFATTASDGSYGFTIGEFSHGFPTHVWVSADDYESWWGLTGFTSAPHQLDLDLYPTSGEPAVAGTLIDIRTGELITGQYFDRWAEEYWEIATVVLYYVGESEPFLTYATEDGEFEAYRVDADREMYVEAWAYNYRWFVSDTFTWDGADMTTLVLEMIPLRWDVPENSTHADAIQWIVESEISTGYADGSYREHLAVTRGQMATFLMRALGLEPAGSDFADVGDGHTHAEGIGAVAAAGITVGYDDGTFRPEASVTRGQMATFLTRALDLEPGEADFTDVDADHAHAEGIGGVAAAGITTGYDDGTFRPNDPVTRGQMATFLWRALAED